MADKRDANEKALVELWRGMHCMWIQMDRRAGFDGLLISPWTGVHIVEIKNPNVRYELTPNEEKVQAEVEARGVIYNIILTDEQAIKLARG
jgi:hypothetical protein